MKITGTIAIFLLFFTVPGFLSGQQPAWQPLGPFGGPVTGLTADGSKAGVLYATASLAGVFKSLDRGNTWNNVLRGGALGNVAVDPTRPATLYAIAYPGVVWKSLDAGTHWTQSGLGLPANARFSSVTVDPARPGRVYLGGDEGVWRSLDAGATWQRASSGFRAASAQRQVLALVAVKRPEGTAYTGLPNGLYRTTDGGVSWKRVGQGLPLEPVGGLLVSPADPKTLYALFSSNRLYATTNGSTWHAVTAPPSGQEYVATLAIDPRSAKILYAGLSNGQILRSDDGARRWSTMGRTPGLGPRALTPDPFTSRVLYTGLDSFQAGVFRSDDGGASWQRRNQGYGALYIPDLSLAVEDPEQVWALAGSDAYRSGNGGRRWIRLPLDEISRPPNQIAVVSNSTAFARAPDQTPPFRDRLWRTEDGGSSWRSVFTLPNPFHFLVSFSLAPSDPATLFVLVNRGIEQLGIDVLRSDDSGASWRIQAIDLPVTCGVGEPQVAPSSAQNLYLTGTAYPACQTRVLRSRDGGATWTNVSAGLPLNGFDSHVTVDPAFPDTAYVGFEREGASLSAGGVWKSSDGGVSWQQAGSELAGLSITALIATATPNRVYAVVANHLVFRSEDGGAHWADVSTGLAAAGQVNVIEAAPSVPERLYVGTATGVWVLAE